MLSEFLEKNRDALIASCRAKAQKRFAPRATDPELKYGIPVFLDQLVEALRMHETRGPAVAGQFVAVAIHPTPSPTDIGRTAARHGNELLRTGYTFDQVVHDYGDLCQAITEMVVEQGKTVPADEFRTLNACLDEAIADAISEFGRQRDQFAADETTRTRNEDLGYLTHELRNLIGNAVLAVATIKKGTVGVSGATGDLLERSLKRLSNLVDQTLVEVRLTNRIVVRRERIELPQFIGEVHVAPALEAASRNLQFSITPFHDAMAIEGDRELLASSVENLLQNAVKFTRPHGRITLTPHHKADRILIEVHDECGGLPEGAEEKMFRPFEQVHHDTREGLGLGLWISRRAVEANGGRLYARNRPGVGCVFTVDLPRPAARIA